MPQVLPRGETRSMPWLLRRWPSGSARRLFPLEGRRGTGRRDDRRARDAARDVAALTTEAAYAP